jgi:hypothetical protein
MSRINKSDYVRSAKQTRQHICHWPGCDKQVPPAMWGCRQHWFKLPATLRQRIWATYQPGQEDGKADVSSAYLDAAKAVQQWIRTHHIMRPAPPDEPPSEEME